MSERAEPSPAPRSAHASWLSRNALPLALVAAPMILLTLFILLPAAQLFGMSLTNYSPGLESRFVGLGNYWGLLQDSGFRAAAFRSVVYVLVVVSLQVTIGLSIAVLLDNTLPFKALWMALLISPFAVSSVVAVVSWKYLLDPSFGFVNYIIASLGLPAVPWFTGPLTSMLPIIIVSTWKGFSFIAIILFAALRAIPAELKEAARVDGATALQIFFFIRLPLILPALAIITLFEVIFAVREFDVVQTMTGGGPGTSTELFSNFLYRNAFANFNFGLGAAVGWFMLVVTLVLASGIVWSNYKSNRA